MRTALLLGARYVAPWLRRKVVQGVKGFLSSGTFAGKKNLDLFRPRMSKSAYGTAEKGYIGQGVAYTNRGVFRGKGSSRKR